MLYNANSQFQFELSEQRKDCVIWNELIMQSSSSILFVTVYASDKGYGKTVHMCGLLRVVALHKRHKPKNAVKMQWTLKCTNNKTLILPACIFNP